MHVLYVYLLIIFNVFYVFNMYLICISYDIIRCICLRVR